MSPAASIRRHPAAANLWGRTVDCGTLDDPWTGPPEEVYVLTKPLAQTPDLPARLSELSPWLDWLVVPEEQVLASLEAQTHRRFIKTHTPLDGVPVEPQVTYVVVARHPLDMAVSLYHQGANLDRERIAELTGQPPVVRAQRPSAEQWLRSWIASEPDPREELDSLPGVMWHLSDAWSRRHEPNVLLVHYDALRLDLNWWTGGVERPSQLGSVIDACLAIARDHAVAPADVRDIEVRVSPISFTLGNRPAPTGARSGVGRPPASTTSSTASTSSA